MCVLHPIHWESMNQGQAINADIYCEQLERVRRILRNCKIPVIFLRDNVRPHVPRQTQAKLQQMGWEYWNILLIVQTYLSQISICFEAENT